MKILITGASGFIGKNLYEYFSKKDEYEVYNPTSSELDLLNKGDVKTYLVKNRFDIILHCATWNKDKDLLFVNNIKMYRNLSCNQYIFGKMIVLGSGAEYDRENWVSGMKETYFSQHVPDDPYGYSKYIIAKDIDEKTIQNIINLRLFSVYGDYEENFRLTSYVFNCILRNEPVNIKRNSVFDFLYVKDLNYMVEWFIHNEGKHCTYNVCSGEESSMESLAYGIMKFLGKKGIISIENNLDVEHYSGDNSRLLKEHDFKLTLINKGIKLYYEWYKNNKGVNNVNKTRKT